MNHVYKGKRKTNLISFALCLFVLLTFSSKAQVVPVDTTSEKLIALPSLSDTTKKDSTRNKVDTFSFRMSSTELESPVVYHADDSAVIDVPAKKMFLYGKVSSLDYAGNLLTAPQIEYDQGSDLVTAFLVKDSTGKVIAFPTYKSGDMSSKMDTIRFNMKTQKGITIGTYTQQGEMYVYGERIKKVTDDVFYAFRGRFTTCNLDTPHFAFVSKRIKLVNQKMAYTGMVHPEFEGVPVPVYLPFGIYPLKQGRHSGLIAPTFTANQQLGLALENIGYYKVFSDYWDMIAQGTIYSYGAWNARVNPRYYKRYKYQGSFSLALNKFRTNFPGDRDFTSNRTFDVTWNHSADNKARPGTNFRASVHVASTRYNEQVPNSPLRNFTNQMQSTIGYSKTWKDKPYNIQITAGHNQNSVSRIVNMNIPDVSFNVNTIYPLRRKEAIGDLKWYENLGIALNTNTRTLTSFIDTAGNVGQQIKDNLQWGASHNVPITLALPSLGPVQITPTVSYQERWYQRKTFRQWNSIDKKVDTIVNEGFYTARDMQFGVGATTRIFGMFGFNKRSKVQAIRHEIRPSVSVNYKPNMNKQNYYRSQIDTSGRIGTFNVFENTIYGGYPEGKFGGIGFSVDNNITMKVRNGKDTAAELKKVSILDGLSLSGNYNFLADSFRLSPLTLNARTNILNKINITATATLDPYQTDPSTGQRIDRLIWNKKVFSLGSFQSGNISLQSSFNGGTNGATVNSPASSNNYINEISNVDASGIPLDEIEQEALYMRNNPGEFADFNIPWSVDFAYSLRLIKIRDFRSGSSRTDVNQDVNWNTSMNLTPKWKIGATGFYNITQKELGTISMYLSREMHCWQMSINVSPVGKFRFFSINISPKSAILRDLRINRTRSFYDL